MIVYLLRNTVNNKVYVGQTVQTLTARWKQHRHDAKRFGYPICCALKKYGCGTFEISELGIASTQEDLNNLECLWIILLHAGNKQFGYNIREGGANGHLSDETKAKMSVVRKGKSNGRLGTHHSEETKAQMRQIHSTRIRQPHSSETKAKISNAHKGKFLSPEHKMKISLGEKRRYA
jgi:group I intron endonuclease